MRDLPVPAGRSSLFQRRTNGSRATLYSISLEQIHRV